MPDRVNMGATINNGKVTNQPDPAAKKDPDVKAKEKTTAKGYKDQFLQLLVAQMKYQDPLEPVSNTEYISQYSTLSMVEQMSNMSSAMELSRAGDYVGKYVVIRDGISEDANSYKEVEGNVDYVTYENGKAFVNVNGQNYKADDVYQVVSSGYEYPNKLAYEFIKALDKLPEAKYMTKADAKTVKNLALAYDKLDEVAKGMIEPKYLQRMKELLDAAKKILGEENKPAGT